MSEGKKEREIVCVGWDGQSKPIYRYRDELDLPDHQQTRVTRNPKGVARIVEASAELTGDKTKKEKQNMSEGETLINGGVWVPDEARQPTVRELISDCEVVCFCHSVIGLDAQQTRIMREKLSLALAILDSEGGAQ